MLTATLLILTLAADGGIRVTLTEADNAQDCQARHDEVVQMLESLDIEPIAALCGQTALSFTPFEHGTPADDEIRHYRVELPAGGGFDITPLNDAADCTPAPQASPAVYCAWSGQQLRSDG